MEAARAKDLALIPEGERYSARNLTHYLAVRQHDLRALQDELSALGLSSLGRSEAHVLATIDAVLNALRRLADEPAVPADPPPPIDFTSGPAQLERHSIELLGPNPRSGRTHVMVTMPSEAADDPELVCNLVRAGMDVMRINCAHDEEDAWDRMIRNLRRAERETGRLCRVMVDLAGPKLRTGAIAPGPRVLKLRPDRDIRGTVTRPAAVWLGPTGHPKRSAEYGVANAVSVAPVVIERARAGDDLSVIDTRGRNRRLKVTRASTAGILAETNRTVYLEDGVRVVLHRGDQEVASGRLDGIPSLIEPLLLRVGDKLRVVGAHEVGHPAQHDADGQLVTPVTIPSTLRGCMGDIKVGERILFDDGKIGALVQNILDDRIEVEITHAGTGGSKLRAEKGINLPDTNLRLKGITEDDIKNLDFIVEHADMVALSFVRDPEDVIQLVDLLQQRNRADIGIILKIETRVAFGFERLAEVQEEILWICEAAHIPVIWATHVLETLAKTGAPSRSEVTDAAMAVRAECVMLNKGPYITEAVRAVSNILTRMEAHQHKKRQMLRKLHVSQWR